MMLEFKIGCQVIVFDKKNRKDFIKTKVSLVEKNKLHLENGEVFFKFDLENKYNRRVFQVTDEELESFLKEYEKLSLITVLYWNRRKISDYIDDETFALLKSKIDPDTYKQTISCHLTAGSLGTQDDFLSSKIKDIT